MAGQRPLAAAYSLLLALMYLVPYSILEEARGWSLYAYWAILGLLALVLSWAATRGWGAGGG